MRQLMTRAQVADHLGIHPNTLDNWRKADPTFPAPMALAGGTLRWRPEWIEQWATSKIDRADLGEAARRIVAEVYG